MSKDLAIVSEYNDCYEEAYRAWNGFYPLADRDLGFYLGNQWDAQEILYDKQGSILTKS